MIVKQKVLNSSLTTFLVCDGIIHNCIFFIENAMANTFLNRIFLFFLLVKVNFFVKYDLSHDIEIR